MTLGRSGLMFPIVVLGSILAVPASGQFLGMEAHVGSPSVDYAADMVLEGKGHVLQGRVFRAGDKERREVVNQGQNMVMIVRLDTRTVYIVVPQMQSYTERSLDDPMLDGMVMDAGDGSDIRIEELGSEVRNGVATTKYQATGTDAKGREVGGVYWQTDEGIIVEANGYTVRNGQRVEGRIALSNIAIGPQDPSMFEPPAGYASGLGAGASGSTAPSVGQGATQDMMIDAMRKQGLSEAQIQQMLKQLEKMQGQ